MTRLNINDNIEEDKILYFILLDFIDLKDFRYFFKAFCM